MNRYYADELAYLRELGADYAREHPAIAPLLATRSTDPDVERLLEGTAFLCGLISERLDQNFPEVVQGLLDITAPSLLRPLPSQSLVQFVPDSQVRGVQHLAGKSQLHSVEIQGTHCTYTPVRPMDIFPARVQSRLVRTESGHAVLEVTLLAQSGIGGWWPKELVLHLHALFGDACQWLWLLSRCCRSIELETDGTRLHLSPAALSPAAPAHEPALRSIRAGEETRGRVTQQPDAFPGADRLRNYFVLPEQFLFVRLTGIGALARERTATRVSLRFHVQARDIPAVSPDLVRINVAPVINLFPCSSEPFFLGQDRHEYRLTPQKDSARQLEIHSIRRLTGIRRGQEQHDYEPWSLLRKGSPCGSYAVRRARSQASGRMEHYVSLLYSGAEGPSEGETLVSELMCFHHSLPTQLHEGDICVPTDTCPAMASFSNILPPSPAMPAPDDTDMQWRLFSCLHANLLPLADVRAMKDFLTLWLPVKDPDPARMTLNRQRIEAVQDFASRVEDRLVKGRPVHGQVLHLELAGECFARTGERFLFGQVLDDVLASFAAINTWTRLEVTDRVSGETLSWTPRLGSRRLL